MFKALLKSLFKSESEAKSLLKEVNVLEPEIKALSNEKLQEESLKLKEAAQKSDDLDSFLSRAFALAREATKRTLNQRPFDVQILGAIALHQGKIAEMRTGEGKTLAATMPAYLNALSGKGVHVVTVNEYLAKRDAVWMGQIYHFLGLKVACLIHEGALLYDPSYISRDADTLLDIERDTTGSFRVQEEFLRPISRKEAYLADITYGTNHEFGFDYLRDNLAHRLEDQVQRRQANIRISDVQKIGGNSGISDVPKIESVHNFAIIDEVDSILIDEARTPLIIAAPDVESSQYYKTFSRAVSYLEKDADYTVDEKFKSVEFTQDGIDKVEKAINIKNLFTSENLRLTHYLYECLKAKALFQRDKDYVVKNNEIVIVDQFTGRLLPGRRYSGGLHQAIEAKEGVVVQNETKTYASISIQNYFRLYKKLAGMTGTAQTSAEEFDKVYGLKVVSIPTNRPMIRIDCSDMIYKTLDAKYRAIANEVKEKYQKGRPVLIGTVSIEKNEVLVKYLRDAGIPHEILNAKNHEREGAIIAQAGKLKAVTVATNMAGRGVDIIFSGNPPDILEAQKIRDLGGLHVIGTERHEARRIDNQLRGRSGRQGDPGSSQFFLSLEDDLMRIFGGERIKSLMQTLNVPEDMPIQSKMLTKAIAQAQSKVEGFNFDARKHLLDYDDVLNKQRLAIYAKRQAILENHELRIKNQELENHDSKFIIPNSALPTVLAMLDFLWMNHLENMESLVESVRLRAYGQHDPLVEYRREGHILFQQLLQNFENWINENKEKLLKEIPNSQLSISNENQNAKIRNWKLDIRNSSNFAGRKIGRNDPCPCGAKKTDGTPIKYKKCHGK
jgi:preprotein translocase subunit SecA